MKISVCDSCKKNPPISSYLLTTYHTIHVKVTYAGVDGRDKPTECELCKDCMIQMLKDAH